MQSSYLFFHFVKHQGNRRLLCERLIPRERCGHAILFQGATKVKARGSGSYEQNGAHTIQRTDKGSGWFRPETQCVSGLLSSEGKKSNTMVTEQEKSRPFSPTQLTQPVNGELIFIHAVGKIQQS
jgi:hypothetical protein